LKTWRFIAAVTARASLPHFVEQDLRERQVGARHAGRQGRIGKVAGNRGRGEQ
jgi:hypothetical protein